MAVRRNLVHSSCWNVTSAQLIAVNFMSCIISCILPECSCCASAQLWMFLHVLCTVSEPIALVFKVMLTACMFSTVPFSLCNRGSVVFVNVTWPCRSIFQCRPSHRRPPAPDPEIQWPHPQTAASVNRQWKHAFHPLDCEKWNTGLSAQIVKNE